MANPSQIERLFNFFDMVSNRCSKARNMTYLEGLVESLNLLLDHETQNKYDDETQAAIIQEMTQIEALLFDKESVRKAIQLALLKGFKQMQVTNAMMTPDSVGYFMAYLINKLMPSPPNIVLDPLAGTGNLLATIANQIPSIKQLIGIDLDPMMCDLSRNLLDALEVNHQIYCQDTLSYIGPMVDLIVTDFPIKPVNAQTAYLPYLTVLHHLTHLKDHHYMIALIENDFFEQASQEVFKQKLLQEAFLFGLIKLDESLFKNHAKSILILQKKRSNETRKPPFLLVDLPAFTDQEGMAKAMDEIELWFKQRKVD